MKAIVFDYGAGNLHSLTRALARMDIDARIESDARAAARAGELLVLPGVGAFGAASARLAPALPDFRASLAAGRPCLGICLGLQLLFEGSDEGPGSGLGIFRGRVTRLVAPRVPHIGWTGLLRTSRECGPEMYFAHSYAARPVDDAIVVSWAMHGADRFPAIVRDGRVAAVQFHPEKSSLPGLELLGALAREVAS